MATQMIVAALAIASFTVRLGLAQSPSALKAGSSSSHQAVVVGCVAQVGDGFLLRTSAATPARAGGGSNSPKASTPIGGNHAPGIQRETTGSNSPKASTPLGVAPNEATGRRTSAVMSAKGSVPIASGAALEHAYELDGQKDQLSVFTDHTVEITGAITAVPSSAAAGKLKVGHLKMLSSTCTM
jgi:hypothetical protein